MLPLFVRAGLFTLAALPLVAQGNELIFIGASNGSTNGPYSLIAADTGDIVHSGNVVQCGNVRGAVWANQGADLYVARASLPTLSPPGITRGHWNGTDRKSVV